MPETRNRQSRRTGSPDGNLQLEPRPAELDRPQGLGDFEGVSDTIAKSVNAGIQRLVEKEYITWMSLLSRGQCGAVVRSESTSMPRVDATHSVTPWPLMFQRTAMIAARCRSVQRNAGSDVRAK